MFRRYAQECLQLAESQNSNESRALLVTMANAWHRLAQDQEQIERHERPFEEPKGK
jgi:hypothetical protein